MTIEYKVLWVEDDNSWYETTKELFSDSLDDLGFKFVSKRCKNIDEVKEEVDANGLKDYDLLLVDYTLKNSDSGDRIIEFIRGIKNDPILTDVLFYSSAVEKVRESMHTLGLEGVYIADRKEIETKFDLVVHTTIKKIQDVNSMRGLIMAETSELDDIMLTIVENFINKGTDHSTVLTDYVFEKVQEFISTSEEKFKQLQESGSIIELIRSPLFHTMIRAKTIQKIVKLLDNSDFADLKLFTNSYDKDVMSVRNNFAHVKEEIDKETGTKILVSHINGKNIEFTNESCIDIRKVLIQYSERLSSLSQVI